MKTFINVNARDMKHAATLAAQARSQGQVAAISGGGSDLLGMVKERIVEPDVLVNLRSVKGNDQVTASSSGVTIGGLITLEALSQHATIKRDYAVLAEAASTVATPQIRNFGTLAGNVCQRPWCWYYRNGFKCYKAGGNQCFSINGENQFHAILGGGPSFIVHPSDTASALVALGATFHLTSVSGERTLTAADFFVLPKQNATHENALRDDELLASVSLPVPRPGTRSLFHKVMDREAWTHAVVSTAIVLEMDGAICKEARIVLGGVAPIPWRVPQAERLLAGQRVTAELVQRVADAALTGANPLAKNAYKIPLTKSILQRSLLDAMAKA